MEQVRWLDEECNVCGNQLNSWDAKLSRTLMYKHKVCEKCIAKEYDMEIDKLRNTMKELYGLLPCAGI